MKRIGIIDIGSNSIRVMLAEIEDSGYFRIIDEIKEPIRFSYDLLESTDISESTFDLALSTLRAFKSLCTGSGAAEIIAVSTDFFKKAKNYRDIINTFSDLLGIEIRILSKEEEIYYNFLSIKNTTYTQNSLMIEITGASTNLAWIKEGKLIKYSIIPLGSMSLTYTHSLNDKINHEDYGRAHNDIEAVLSSVEWLKETSFDNIIGVGAIFRNLGKIDQRKKRYPLFITHNYIFNDFDISDILNVLKSKNLKQRIEIQGLSYDSADIIVASTLMIQSICRYVNVSEIEICGRGLREGILFEYIKNNYKPIEDILDYSILGIMETLHVNTNHGKHVYEITRSLFTQLESLHGLDRSYEKIVKTASLLHDCGISLKYYNHHKHSFYIILNSYMNGLTHKELLISALTAACHRNNSYTVPFSQYCSILNRLDVQAIEKMGVLLKIAEGLDRSLEGAVTKVHADISKDTVLITVYSSVPLDLEIRQALKARETFNEIYHRKLQIVNVTQ